MVVFDAKNDDVNYFSQWFDKPDLHFEKYCTHNQGGDYRGDGGGIYPPNILVGGTKINVSPIGCLFSNMYFPFG